MVEVGWVIVDCHDPERLAAFWSALLDLEIENRVGPFVFLRRRPRRQVSTSNAWTK
jgi:hypothetical protein